MPTEDDLILGEGEQPEAEEEVFYAETTPCEYISSAYNAIEICSSVDLQMVSKAERTRIEQTKKKCFKLIHYAIAELYSEVFGEEDEE